MGNDADLWEAALTEAQLSAAEEDLLATARNQHAGLGDELTLLLGHLRANLSAEFLRVLVDNLRTGLDPELCVVRSLRETIATSTLMLDLSNGGSASG